MSEIQTKENDPRMMFVKQCQLLVDAEKALQSFLEQHPLKSYEEAMKDVICKGVSFSDLNKQRWDILNRNTIEVKAPIPEGTKTFLENIDVTAPFSEACIQSLIENLNPDIRSFGTLCQQFREKGIRKSSEQMEPIRLHLQEIVNRVQGRFDDEDDIIDPCIHLQALVQEIAEHRSIDFCTQTWLQKRLETIFAEAERLKNGYTEQGLHYEAKSIHVVTNTVREEIGVVRTFLKKLLPRLFD